MPIPLLEVSNLTSERQGSVLFSNLNFALMPGALLQVVGNNGSGKTSLLKILSGLLAIEQGKIQRREKSVLYLGHKLGIKLGLTVMENLQELATLHQIFNPKSLHQALDRFELNSLAHRPCTYLSAGQKQRVALARLAFLTLKLWILDEPFAHLDQENCAKLMQCINEHCAAGGGVILTTHQKLHFAVTPQTLLLS